MPFEIVRNDMTQMKVDAVVNSANPLACIGYGVDSALHAAAGPELFEARKKIGPIPVGSAVITPAFQLHAKYVIHTVGPLWQGGTNHEIDRVQDCYRNSLQLALDNNCTSIAFPLISTGTYGFPKSEALQIAISVVSEFLFLHEMQVFLVVYDKTSYALSEKLFSSVSHFIDDHYVAEHQEVDDTFDGTFFELRSPTIQDKGRPVFKRNQSRRSLSDLMDHLDESFSQSLLRLIREKGKTDVEVYKRANIDRKLFSKIRSNTHYNPSKITVLSFAIALELNLDETKDLLGRAGFALSHCSKFDVIIAYLIQEKNYNVFEINEVLFAFHQDLLCV